jgi:hypothetical protein
VSRSARLRAAGVLLALAAGLTGCGESSPEADVDVGAGEDPGEGAEQQGTPQTVDCPADATAVDLPADFPAPLPEGTVVVAVEMRDEDRTVVTGVVPRSQPDVLVELQDTYAAAGIELTEGETEERDAESNFEGRTSDGQAFVGRWGIQALSDCDPAATRIDVVTQPS